MNISDYNHEEKVIIWVVSALNHLQELKLVTGGRWETTQKGETIAAYLREIGFLPTPIETYHIILALTNSKENAAAFLILIKKFCIDKWASIDDIDDLENEAS